MIQQMDQVYANAFVTIIAACSTCACEGLSGVHDRPRYLGRVTIGKTHLFQLSTVGSDNVKLSKWATRGWTQQEGYLSRRRLIFTENEVLLLCNEVLVKETQLKDNIDPYCVSRPIRSDFGNGKFTSPLSRTDILTGTFDWLMPLVPRAAHFDGLPHHYFVEKQIEEYTNRHLSEPTDRLNGILGILKFHERNSVGHDGPVSHSWGIPLQLMKHSGQFFFNLFWTQRQITERIEELPSWSWSGWRGPINYGSLEQVCDYLPSPFPQASAAINIEKKSAGSEARTVEHDLEPTIRVFRDDKLVDLRLFLPERQLQPPREVAKALVITSFVVPLRFCHVDTYPTNRIECESSPLSWRKHSPIVLPRFAVRPGVFLGFPPYWDTAYDPESHELGLVLPSSGKFHTESRSPAQSDNIVCNIIILHRAVDWRASTPKYKRAGILGLSYYPASGRLKRCTQRNYSSEANSSWCMHLDEQGHGIQYLGDEGPPNEYFFLKGAKWRTIYLV